MNQPSKSLMAFLTKLGKANPPASQQIALALARMVAQGEAEDMGVSSYPGKKR